MDLQIKLSEMKNLYVDLGYDQFSGDGHTNLKLRMSNMTEKVIKDGSETKRAKYNMVCSIIGSFLILIGIILLLVKGMSVAYIDAQGILHENFFLIPIGFLCVFSGLVSFVTVGIGTIISKLKNRK